MADIYSDNRILVYVDVDAAGNVMDGEAGKRIIPSKQYQHYFITTDEGVLVDLSKYKIESGQLVLR